MILSSAVLLHFGHFRSVGRSHCSGDENAHAVYLGA